MPNFKIIRQIKKQKRINNRLRSTQLLDRLEVPYINHDHGLHLEIREADMIIDYYPSTGLFINRISREKGRGVQELLKTIKWKK